MIIYKRDQTHEGVHVLVYLLHCFRTMSFSPVWSFSGIQGAEVCNGQRDEEDKAMSLFIFSIALFLFLSLLHDPFIRLGSQQSNDLKDALDSEMEKTKLMEESMGKLDEEMKRSDLLLSQMMPKSVSEKVKNIFDALRYRGGGDSTPSNSPENW